MNMEDLPDELRNEIEKLIDLEVRRQTAGLNNALEELKLQIKKSGQAESQEDRATLVAFSGELDTYLQPARLRVVRPRWVWKYPCTLLFGV